MKKLFFIFLISIFTFVTSCQNGTNKPLTKIDTDNILFSTKVQLNINTLVKKIDYIALDVNSENSLFRDAHKVIIRENKIFILDIITKCLLVFNEKGAFLNKIGATGDAPGEFIIPSDFDIDNFGNTFIYNGPKKEILVYNKENMFIRSMKLPFDIDNFAVLPNGKFFFSLAVYNNRECNGYQVAITDSSLMVENKYIQYEDQYDPNYILETFLQKKSNGGVIYYKPIDDNAYVFTEKGDMEKILHFNMGEYTLPLEMRKNIKELKEKYAESFDFVLNTPVLIKDYIIGTMVKRNEIVSFAYNIHENSIYENKKFRCGDLNYPVSYINDSTFISILNEIIYPEYYSDQELTENQKAYIQEGGTLLCKYILK